MHRQIAEALEALHPEPTLAHRLELARHYFAWEPGPSALRYLVEAAELSEGLGAYDSALEAVDLAIRCLPAMPSAERPSAQVELRLFRARALLYAGRCDAGGETSPSAAIDSRRAMRPAIASDASA